MASNKLHTIKHWSNKFYAMFTVFCSMHGLVRGENMELGRDSDTGGQVVILPVIFVSINKYERLLIMKGT